MSFEVRLRTDEATSRHAYLHNAGVNSQKYQEFIYTPRRCQENVTAISPVWSRDMLTPSHSEINTTKAGYYCGDNNNNNGYWAEGYSRIGWDYRGKYQTISHLETNSCLNVKRHANKSSLNISKTRPLPFGHNDNISVICCAVLVMRKDVVWRLICIHPSVSSWAR